MQTAEQLTRRINSATDLLDIVRTMKSLAAVSINRYERAVNSIDEYYRTVLLGLQAVLQTGPTGMRRQQERRTERRRLGVVVFGSDQGMCGGFNDRIGHFTVSRIPRLHDNRSVLRLICVGGRVAAFLEAAGLFVEEVYAVPGSLDGIVPQSQNILAAINAWRQEDQVNTIKLFHNSKGKGVSFQQEEIHLLPLADEWYGEIASRPWQSRSLPVYTIGRNRLFSLLLRQYLFVSLYRAFAQSMATENSGRLSSMQAAEENIDERLEELFSEYRRQRQSSITSELLDIVSGFEALSSEK